MLQDRSAVHHTRRVLFSTDLQASISTDGAGLPLDREKPATDGQHLRRSFPCYALLTLIEEASGGSQASTRF